MPTEAAIRTALTSGRYALVGAGQLGVMSLGLWPADVPRPEYILDSVRTGDLDGIAIRPLGSHVPEPGVTYLLSAFKMPQAEILGIFARLGQRHVLTVYDFFEEYTPSVFTNGWRNVAPSPETKERLARLPSLYADKVSSHICDAVTAWRYERVLTADYPASAEDDKYDLRHFGRGGQQYDVIYDGGSFDLGLLASLTKAGISWGQVMAFEPDPACMAICAQRHDDAPITLDPHALSDRTGTARFLASGLLSARLIEDAALVHPDMIAVETCTLDDVHQSTDQRVLVKLHIEGAELAALRGAAGLIASTSVDLLINISHDERSWLDIPEYLAATGRFDLYLRSHALFGEGLTLFARNRSM